MYVILINDDNTMMATQKQRIMQRSKLVDDFWFLTNQMYNGYDMSKFTVSMEYVLPISRQYKNEFLALSNETYNGYLKYILPIDTELTSEAGDIEIQLSFVLADLDEFGKSVQRVRKISSTRITVFPITAWSDVIPDSALSALDQRIIKTDAQIKALSELVIDNSVNDLDYDDVRNELQLKAGDKLVGTRVALVGGQASLEEGIPVIDLELNTDKPGDEDVEDDGIVEF